jgi:hypothetical protein
MTEQEVFVLADRTLNDLVAKIGDGQWDMQPPRVDVPDDAPLQDRLLGLTGRDPYAA